VFSLHFFTLGVSITFGSLFLALVVGLPSWKGKTLKTNFSWGGVLKGAGPEGMGFCQVGSWIQGGRPIWAPFLRKGGRIGGPRAQEKGWPQELGDSALGDALLWGRGQV